MLAVRSDSHLARRPQCAIALDAAPGEQAQQNQGGEGPAPVYPALPCRIIRRCGSFQSFFLVSRRDVHPLPERTASRRFSGLAFHSAERSASRSSARPLRVSFCLRVSHSLSEGTR